MLRRKLERCPPIGELGSCVRVVAKHCKTIEGRLSGSARQRDPTAGKPSDAERAFFMIRMNAVL